MRGKFITIEGCEGVGKSTQNRLLKEYFARNGIEAVFTREPGGTPIAEQIRKVILDSENTEMDSITELLLYTAARRQHTSELIERELSLGKIVVCDRYIDSTMAYQGYARGLDRELIARLNRLAMGSTKIDLTLLLDVDSSSGFRRKGGADASDRLENEGAAFHANVYRGFVAIAENEPGRVAKIDARGSKEQTHQRIIDVLIGKGVIAL